MEYVVNFPYTVAVIYHTHIAAIAQWNSNKKFQIIFIYLSVQSQ